MRVVVVDDHPGIRFLVRSLAEELGYEVVGEAANGTKALDEVALHEPELVVMDFSMPGMDGLEATRVIKRLYPDIQVIAFTSSADPDVQQGFLDAGACDHVDKGESDLLRDALRRCGSA